MLRDDGHVRTSSFCTGGACLGVELVGDAVVLIDRDQPHAALRITRDEWAAFVAGVKAGEFDLDQP